jgi:hypothetical protein
MWRTRTIAVCGIALAILAGCGGSNLVPVEGTITLDGKPVTEGTIGMELVGGPKDFRLFSGETDAAGHYVIRPFEHGGTGAVPGEYRVMIHTVKAPPGADELTEIPKDPVPQEYQNGSKTLTVPEGGITNADFAIKTR